MSELDARNLVSLAPPAPPSGGDLSLSAVATVLEVNADQALVRVQLYESGGSWVPAVAGRYQVGKPARVLLDPWSGGRTVLVLGPVLPHSPWVLATVTALNTDPDRAVVAWGGASWTVPFIPAVYTVGTEVWVGLDDWGRPALVHSSSDDAPPPQATAPQAPSGPPGRIQVTLTVLPQWSGSYRAGSGWDRWNASRREYGGRSTLYQGNGFGSGPMTGLATYGDQLVNLAAISIDRVQVMLRGVGLSGAAGPATVQGSPHGAQPAGAPTSSGTTATGNGLTDLDAATREGLRTGVLKGLALVGANYWAVAGAGNGDGMALIVTATIPN